MEQVDPRGIKLSEPKAIDDIRSMTLPTFDMPKTDFNFGNPYIIFETLRFQGAKRIPMQSNWMFQLDSVAGTLDHIVKYQNKPGWKIIAFGNLTLNGGPGIQQDTVEEHRRIYKHCQQVLGTELKTGIVKEAAARKVAEALKRAEESDSRLALAMAEIDKLTKEKTANGTGAAIDKSGVQGQPTK